MKYTEQNTNKIVLADSNKSNNKEWHFSGNIPSKFSKLGFYYVAFWEFWKRNYFNILKFI